MQRRSWHCPQTPWSLSLLHPWGGGAPDLTSALRDVAAAVREHLLPLQVPLKCLTLVLPLFLLVLLLFLLGAPGDKWTRIPQGWRLLPVWGGSGFGHAFRNICVDSYCVSLVHQVPSWGSWCIFSGAQMQGRTSLGLGTHVATGVHLLPRHLQRTASRGRRLLGGRHCGTVLWWDTLSPRRVEKFLSCGPLGLWLHLLGCLNYDPPCWRHGRHVYIIDFRSLIGGVILQFRQ